MSNGFPAAVGLGLGLVLMGTGCRHASPPPSALSDGSPARPPPVALAGVDGTAVMTRVQLLEASAIEPGTAAARCLGTSNRIESVVVERVDVRGASVTYLAPDHRSVHTCEGGGESPLRWCGRAFGRLAGGRLHDPRVSLTCRGGDGDPIAFAWIQPGGASAYIAVAHHGHSEVYPVAGGLPVRISTKDVDLAASRATFAVSEHARDGRRLTDYELEAAVSG